MDYDNYQMSVHQNEHKINTQPLLNENISNNRFVDILNQDSDK